jgi:hypothetical protein
MDVPHSVAFLRGIDGLCRKGHGLSRHKFSEEQFASRSKTVFAVIRMFVRKRPRPWPRRK